MSERKSAILWTSAFTVAGSALCLVAVGFLEIRAEAVEAGAVIDWKTLVEGVDDPGMPWLQRLAVVLICMLALYPALRWLRDDRRRSPAPVLSSAGVYVAFIAYFVFTTDPPYSAITTSIEAPESPVLSWFRAGALSPAVQVLAGATLLIAVVGLTRSNRPAAPTN